MKQSDRDLGGGAAQLSLRFTRRLLLISSAAVVGGWAVAQPWPVRSAADHDDRFMVLSRLLIPHSLDPEIGRRIAAALKVDQSPLRDHINSLLKLAHDRHASVVEDFFPLASEAAKASALRIIAAWYLGVVDDAPDAKSIAYELALMFKPTSDVMTIPTYSISKPNGWGTATPALSAMPTF